MATGHKTGGRQKGTPNRTTVELRELLKGIATAQINVINQEAGEPIEGEYSGISLSDRINLLTKILPYIAPRMNTEEESI